MLEILAVIGFLISSLWLIATVFQQEGIGIGVLCIFFFPITYFVALFNVKAYNVAFGVHLLSILSLLLMSYELE